MRILFACCFVLALAWSERSYSQETAAWPGYEINYYQWGQCHYPWTDPGPMACAAPANAPLAGYVPFLAQIFVDRPDEDFIPAHRWRGKELFQKQHICGGTLVAPDWVLTAAHCIRPDQIEKGYKVKIGVHDISNPQDGYVMEIAEVIHHPNFRTYRRDDIALIRLKPRSDISVGNPPPFDRYGISSQFETPTQAERPIYFIDVARPVGTPANRMPWGFETVTIYGWGKSENVEGDAASPLTYHVTLKALTNDFCARLDGYGIDKVFDTTFCAVDALQKTCRGDSGGPVLDAMGHVIGIVSWGKRQCLGDGQPGVYTRVASYTDWVDSVIADSLKQRRANGETP